MTEHDERVEALAKVIAEAWGNDSDLPHEADPYDEAPEFFDNVARALLDSPAMRDLLAAERAKALREVADEAERDAKFCPDGCNLPSCREANRTTARWLRERADRIHSADPEETR